MDKAKDMKEKKDDMKIEDRDMKENAQSKEKVTAGADNSNSDEDQ